MSTATQELGAEVDRLLEAAISDHGEVGLQVCAYLDGECLVDTWAGIADLETGMPVSADTLFPVFSTTKAATEVALHIAAERGWLDYSDPIAKHWPEFGQNGKEKGTVFDLLTHRLGVPMMPAGVTPELMCDWDWMVSQIAAMHPLWEPGTRTAHHAYTFGFVAGEIVRRVDPKERPFGAFVREEVCEPLGIEDLWLGIPDEAEARVARLIDLPPLDGFLVHTPDSIGALVVPPQVFINQAVFGRPDVRRSCHPAAGGLMNARSVARLFAMLACGGELDGVRLLSERRVESFLVERPPFDFDPVYVEYRGSVGGFWLTEESHPLSAPAGHGSATIAAPGGGGSIGWADLDTRLAVGITHNRLVAAATPSDNPLVPIGDAIRKAL